MKTIIIPTPEMLPRDHKVEFRERLRNMLVRHFSIVADQISREAVLRRTTIRRLVFCVPNAWDKPNFQDVLRPIMDEVAEGVETYCVFESEALAQFILHQHSYLLEDYEFVLVCDFGGHFMVSAGWLKNMSVRTMYKADFKTTSGWQSLPILQGRR